MTSLSAALAAHATPPTTPDPAPLRIDNLHFAYEPHSPLIEGISAETTSGSLNALLGPNAAGKSTLLKLLLGYLEPTHGYVLLHGRPVHRIPAPQRAAWISYVPQRSTTEFGFTARQVVEMGRQALRHDPHAIDHALEITDLAPHQHKVFAHLSAGQQQRVLLARAIAQSHGQGQVVLLDEPVSAADLGHAHDAMRHLVALARSGLTVIVALHDLNLAAQYADSVWLLDQGRLAAQGPWQEVLQPSVLQPVYSVEIEWIPTPNSPRPILHVKPPAV